jgi:hypothetical protein
MHFTYRTKQGRLDLAIVELKKAAENGGVFSMIMYSDYLIDIIIIVVIWQYLGYFRRSYS